MENTIQGLRTGAGRAGEAARASGLQARSLPWRDPAPICFFVFVIFISGFVFPFLSQQRALTVSVKSNCRVGSCQEFLNKMEFFFFSISINIDMPSLIIFKSFYGVLILQGSKASKVTEILD